MPESGRLHRGITRYIGRHLHPYWPVQIKDIVFVVGCPRSGTSILGRIMAQHPRFLYMHEPRYVWRQVDPDLNVWRGHATRGKLLWDEQHSDQRTQRLVRRWFHLAYTLGGRRRLVEKLPLNVFRLRWLVAMFPQAKIVHMIRHARDTALSLQQAIEQWFSLARGYPPGYWESSWHYLMFEEYAEGKPELAQQLSTVRSLDDNYARALFVWLCCAWEGCRTGACLEPGRYLAVRYEDLVDAPDAELQRVLSFLDVPDSRRMVRYARATLHDRSLDKTDPAPHVTIAIAGDMLTELGYSG